MKPSRFCAPQLSDTEADRETYLNIAQVYERARRYKRSRSRRQSRRSSPRRSARQRNDLVPARRHLRTPEALRQSRRAIQKSSLDSIPATLPRSTTTASCSAISASASTKPNRWSSPRSSSSLSTAHISTASAGFTTSRANTTTPKPGCTKPSSANPTTPTFARTWATFTAKQGRPEQAAAEWEKSLTEWHRSLPADMEPDKIAEVEKKVGSSKHRVAQKSAPPSSNKQQ